MAYCGMRGLCTRTRDMFVSCRGREGDAPTAGDTLVVPAVSLGNIGQLACDLLLNTVLQLENEPKLMRVGFIRTDNVLPMMGNNPLDDPNSDLGDLGLNVEVFRIPGRKIVIVQIRAPVGEGCMRAFTDELTQWAAQVRFDRVIMVGAADSASGTDQEVMSGQVRFVSSSSLNPEEKSRMVVTELGAKPVLPSSWSNLDMAESPFPITKSGLLNPMFLYCEARRIPFIGLVVFCKEGNNIPEACLMAAATCSVLPVFTSPPRQWFPPRSWGWLDGAGPEVSLFQ